MNTTCTNTPLATRTTALTACLIALYAGALGCGTNNGTAKAPAAIAEQGGAADLHQERSGGPGRVPATAARQADRRDPSTHVRRRPTPLERAGLESHRSLATPARIRPSVRRAALNTKGKGPTESWALPRGA
jgi:hypothetical protein